MKKRIISTILIVLILSISFQAFAEVNYIKQDGLTYFIPWYTLENEYSATEWMASEETRAQLTMSLSHDYVLVQEDAQEFEFEIDAQQLSYLGLNGEELFLTIVSDDMRKILFVFFDVPEKVARAMVLHGREPTPKEKIETSNKAHCPDGFFVIDNRILENLYQNNNLN